MDSDDASSVPRPRPRPRGGDPLGDVEVVPEPAPGRAPAVERGFVLAYRLYDVAQEIDLRQVERLVAQGATRLRLLRQNSQYLELRDPPVSVSLGTREVAVPGGSCAAELQVRVYDYGSLAFVLRVPVVPGTAFDDLIALADMLDDGPELGKLCREEAAALSKRLLPAMRQPQIWDGE